MTFSFIQDTGYVRLKDFIISTTGLAFYTNRDEDLALRIDRRMSHLGVKNTIEYLDILKDSLTGASERDALINELTIGETYFFRHQELFNALKEVVLPDLIERNRHRQSLRIWSAGCATGAEPYSLSILLRRTFAHRISGWQIHILGTDINREFLIRAHEGRFEEWAFRATSEDLRYSCFTKTDKFWVVAPEYREGVSFEYHNLVAQPFPSLLNNLADFDLVLCRNVMIYFSNTIIGNLIQQFYQCLVDGGWFVVGHAESNIEMFRSFQTVNRKGATLYQKLEKNKKEKPISLSFQSRPPEEIKNAPSVWHLLTSKEKGSSPLKPVRRFTSFRDQEKKEQKDISSAFTLADIRLLSNSGNYKKALACCQELIKNDMLNSLLYFYQGLIQDHLGQHQEAERSMRQATYLDRNFVLAQYYLGLFLQKKKDFQNAVRFFRNVLRLLSGMDGNELVDDGKEIRAEDLKKMTEMHIEGLNGL